MNRSVFIHPPAKWLGRIFFTALVVGLMLGTKPIPVVQAMAFEVDTSEDRSDDSSPRCTPAPDDCSLREAILTANTAPDMDTITLKADTTYELAEGELEIKYSLELKGGGQNSTIITGGPNNQQFRIFSVNGLNSPSVTISGLNIENGFGDEISGGGGIRIGQGSSVVLNDVAIRSNTGDAFGGGINNNGGTLELINSVVEHNKILISFMGGGGLAESGGGILLNGSLASLTIRGSKILNNLAVRGGGHSQPGRQPDY
jgi:CSLREA domain-containing protein